MKSLRNFCILALLLLAQSLYAQPARPVGAVLDRLMRMTPAQRQRQLAKMAPERRAQLEKRLEEYDRLPAAQKERLRAQTENFQSLPPDQQQTVRANFRRLNSLPEERRVMVRRVLRQLRAMPEAERNARMNSNQFHKRFSPDEREIMESLVKLVPQE